jgi:hypothetical protein
LKRFLKIVGILLLVVILLVVVVGFALTTEKAQNRLAKEATSWLSNKLDTKVAIDNVKIDFLNRVHFQGLYIEDQQQDTLAFIHDFSVNSTNIISDLWSDKTSIIKNVKLDGGVVNLIRPNNSNKWNYAFIEEAFATESTDSSEAQTPKIDLKNVALSNVRFSMIDKWVGQDLVARVGDLDLRVNGMDLDELNFQIKSVDVSNTDFSFKDYVGGEPKRKKKIDQTDWGTAFNPDSIMLTLETVNLDKVNFEYQLKNHQSKAGRFDEKHIVASNIKLDLENVQAVGETIMADILHLSTVERCGLVLNKFKGHVLLSQQEATLTDFYVKTEHSEVKNYFSMRYINFHDFNEFIENVQMYAKFKNSYIDKRDIAFFAGEIRQLPVYARLNGKAEGTVANLTFSNIQAQAPNIDFDGSGKITGLPDVDNTFFDLKAKRLLTTGPEIIRIAPEAKTDAVKWNEISRIDFAGTFKGTTKKFNADGDIKTNLGNSTVDLFMNLEKQTPSYKGYVNAKRLNLGRILGNKEVGIVTAKGTIEGRGFDFENVVANVKAEVAELNYDGNRYENITVNGDVQNKKFFGFAKSRDARLGFDFEGKLDLSGDTPIYDFKSDIIRINLKTLGIVQQDIILKAKVNLDFTGKNIDDFIGKAIMQDVTMSYDNEVIRIPRLRLNSYYSDNNNNNNKVLDLKSTVADARIEGRYSIRGIDKSIRSFLHYYLPTYISNETLPENEIFDFNVLVRKANKIINIFEPKLQVDSGTVFQGSINTPNQRLDLVGLVPSVTYDGVRLNNVGIKSNGNPTILNSEIVAANLFTGKSEILKDATLKVGMSNDTIRFKVKTNSADDFLGEANLDGKATAFSDRIEVMVNPSTFIVKDDRYQLFSSYPIQYTNDGILLAKDVLIQNGNQQLVFNADHNGVTNNAFLKVENLDLEKVSNYIGSKELELNGRVNSDITVTDIWGKVSVDGTLRTVDYFRIYSDTLGDADIQFSYNKDKNALVIKEGSKIVRDNAFVFTRGDINFNDNKLNLAAELKNTPIDFANQFMAGIVENLKGEATGEIDVKGSFDNPVILGDMAIRKAGLKVVFTGCSYTMDDINLKLNERSVVFNPITIYDERQDNEQGTAQLTGTVLHNNYEKYRLKLHVVSNDILGLNTDQFNGELFYGKISSTLDMKISGEIDDLVMDIKAEPLEKSQFYLPLEDGGEVGTYDFIKYRTLGRYQEEKQKKNRGNSYFKVNMDIKATPKVMATIILDPNTQEKIEARGSGNIKLYVDLGNEIQMFNTFTVKEGIYKFNFRGLLSKDFDLEEGGTITWSGNAYKADLDMTAVYKTRASLYSLVSDQELTSDEIKRAKNVEDTYVSIDLDGPLSKPEITFDISQPNNRVIGGVAQDELTRIKSDQNQVIYQAGMLLLFNSFKPSTGGLNTGSLAANTSLSTASDFVSSILSQQITNTIGKLGIPNFTIDIGHNRYSADVTSGGFGSTDQFSGVIQGSFFKDRVLISYGNTVDIANAAAQAGGANGATYNGDFRGQYLLTPDGRYSLSAFRVSTFDYVQNEPVARGGVGLSYKKSFNNWGDLFRRNEKGIKDVDVEEEDEPTTGFIINKKEPSVSTALDLIKLLSF